MEKITITLKLSESLLCILKDAGNPRPETFQIQVEPGSSIRRVLASQSINPLLVPMISRDSRKIPLDTILEEDVTLTLYGPLAGG
ncbi:hypothetical protein [Desulfospira joergensenii]|uniref:hypothetical protein n=1 Tax=Desulfospira joergensenii TaxID=53329 RepID=UPI0012946C11|nr:hypothetical protein [Desulfospira joergensenii]